MKSMTPTEPAEIVPAVPSFEDHVSEWRKAEIAVENGLWGLAAIASSIAGNFESGAVKQFARQTGYTPGRIYQLAYAHQLKASIPDIGGARPSGKPLTVAHFTLASGSSEPQALMRRAVEEDWSSTRVGKEVRQERDALGRYKRTRKRGTPRGSIGDFCEACGGHLAALPNLGKVMGELSLDASGLASRADVPDSVIEDMLEGYAVNQPMGIQVVDAIRVSKAEEAQRKESLGL